MPSIILWDIVHGLWPNAYGVSMPYISNTFVSAAQNICGSLHYLDFL